MTERNIAIKLSYDGSNYHGWQIQKNDITVGETVQNALALAVGHPVKLVGCGRTDAGVHALRYCANFMTTSKIPTEKIPLAVNTRLPSDIAVSMAVEAEPEFNAIGSCIKKEYVYRILNSRIRAPFLHDRVCFYPSPIDFEKLERACRAFEGTHDFKAVRSVGTETKTTVRTVYYCNAVKNDDIIEVRVCANGFLYNMARAIVGTAVYAGHGKIEPEEIPSLLEKGDRRLTGPTMPPQGLYMSKLWYEGEVGKMMTL